MPIKKLSLFLMLGAALVFGGCSGEPEKPAPPQDLPTVKVRTMSVSAVSFARSIEISGTVEAVQAAAIAAKVTGVIDQMPVTLGSQVQKGDMLVKISASEISAKVTQAEAYLEQAKRNYEREKRLLAKGAAAPEAVKTLEEQYRIAEAALGEAKAMQAYTVIRAPFAGQVAQKMAKAGDMAMVGMSLLVLENNDQLQIVAAVPEAMALTIKTGDTLPFSIPAAQYTGQGVVAEMARVADSASRTTLLKITITDGDKIRAGQYARVGLSGAASPSLMVPVAAVSRMGQMEKIFVVQHGRAELRLVRTGEEQSGQIEIVSGLSSGEQVVIEGADQLQDRQPVLVEP